VTTIVVDLRAKVIAADTQNTDSSGTAYRCHKIDRLSDGRYFLGSGHLLTIGKARRWAEKGFAEKHRPNFGELFGEGADEFRFSCAVIDRDFRVTLLDDEMEPQPLCDHYFALGTGGAYAMGAMDHGATAEAACLIACARDMHTSAPVEVEAMTFPNQKRGK
jgi:hypothetical protein